MEYKVGDKFISLIDCCNYRYKNQVYLIENIDGSGNVRYKCEQGYLIWLDEIDSIAPYHIKDIINNIDQHIKVIENAIKKIA